MVDVVFEVWTICLDGVFEMWSHQRAMQGYEELLRHVNELFIEAQHFHSSVRIFAERVNARIVEISGSTHLHPV